MTLWFTLIFLLSLAGGAAWGYINDLTAAGYIISLAVAGFAGSSIIAMIFSCLYFCQKDTDEEETEMLGQKRCDHKEIKRIKK